MDYAQRAEWRCAVGLLRAWCMRVGRTPRPAEVSSRQKMDCASHVPCRMVQTVRVDSKVSADEAQSCQVQGHVKMVCDTRIQSSLALKYIHSGPTARPAFLLLHSQVDRIDPSSSTANIQKDHTDNNTQT
jgi:hypothetical protein